MATYGGVAVSRCMIYRQRQESSYLEDSPMGRICYAHGSSVVVLPRDVWVVASVRLVGALWEWLV